MNKIGRGPQGDAIYQISGLLGLPVSEKKNFEVCLFVPTCDPWGGANFDSRGII